MIKIIRLKSDNYDCFVSTEAYREIRLSMSSGDFGAHKAREVTVSSERLGDIMFHRPKGPGYVDFGVCGQGDEMSPCFFYYDGSGDCNVEFAE